MFLKDSTHDEGGERGHITYEGGEREDITYGCEQKLEIRRGRKKRKFKHFAGYDLLIVTWNVNGLALRVNEREIIPNFNKIHSAFIPETHFIVLAVSWEIVQSFKHGLLTQTWLVAPTRSMTNMVRDTNMVGETNMVSDTNMIVDTYVTTTWSVTQTWLVTQTWSVIPIWPVTLTWSVTPNMVDDTNMVGEKILDAGDTNIKINVGDLNMACDANTFLDVCERNMFLELWHRSIVCVRDAAFVTRL